jgi:hypothetical protein
MAGRVLPRHLSPPTDGRAGASEVSMLRVILALFFVFAILLVVRLLRGTPR